MSEEYGTVGGVPVSEDDIAAMVANAEAGFPGVTMRRARPVRPSMGEGPSRTVSVRLDPQLDAALTARQRESGQTTSELIRAALIAHRPAACSWGWPRPPPGTGQASVITRRRTSRMEAKYRSQEFPELTYSKEKSFFQPA